MAGRPIVVDTRKALAIVALIAAEGRPYARDELTAMFWPEADDEDARGALRRTLSTLRTAVGDHGLVIERAQVALDAATSIDLVDLERLAASGTIADLETAAGLARGPFMAGFALRGSPGFDDWQATRAMRVERTVGGVLERLATARFDRGDPAGAVEVARRRVELDPLDELGQRRLIELLALSGDRTGAIRQLPGARRAVRTGARRPATARDHRSVRGHSGGPTPVATRSHGRARRSRADTGWRPGRLARQRPAGRPRGRARRHPSRLGGCASGWPPRADRGRGRHRQDQTGRGHRRRHPRRGRSHPRGPRISRRACHRVRPDRRAPARRICGDRWRTPPGDARRDRPARDRQAGRPAGRDQDPEPDRSGMVGRGQRPRPAARRRRRCPDGLCHQLEARD